MAFRSKQLMKKILKKVGEQNLPPVVKEQLKRSLPNSKVISREAHRGLFAGRHIRHGDQVSEKGGNTSKRTWKPNVQGKRLFSYILDRHVRVNVTIHALRCIDKAGGLDEYLLKTPYHRMDTELGLYWKARIEKLYEELGNMEVVFLSQEAEPELDKQFGELKVAEKTARRDAKRELLGLPPLNKGSEDAQEGDAQQGDDQEDTRVGESSGVDADSHEPKVALG